MQDLTMRIVSSAIEADATIPADMRRKFLAQLQTGATPDRVISIADAADRFNRSRRTITAWANQGLLARVILPGRKRGCGFRESDVARLISGGK